MPGFPRGVVDGEGRRAVVYDRGGTLIALDPATGAVRWRHGSGLRPCALLTGGGSEGAVVALDFETSRAPRVTVLDAATGEERRTSAELVLPEWVRPTLHDSAGFTVSTEEEGDDRLVIRWSARASYGGGAPPSPRAAAEEAREAYGALRVDLSGDRPSVRPLTEPAARPPPPPGAPAPGPSVLGPDVLEYALVGGLRVELAARAGGGGESEVVLRAVEPRTGAPVWELVLDRTVESRARRFRP
ncbi:PQQ-binding-like beta-propeller repeat protein [Streptomyces sp. NPDC057011]|uniref:outer membrane protein assembly factor BamB family protein n=1 Tax=unclassified Streptomyces TaxID=2593676 RepID=UPI003632FBD0